MDLIAEMNQKALELGVPISVHLDVTYRCNERCVHCYLDHDDHGEMTTAEIKDVLDQLAEAGVFFLTFSGGEVFMRRDFFEIVEYARRLLLNVKIKTNAVMIREKEARQLRELMCRAHPDQRLFASSGSARRHHQIAGLAEAHGHCDTAAAVPRNEGARGQCPDDAKHGGPCRCDSACERPGSGLHHRPNGHTDDGRRSIDREAATGRSSTAEVFHNSDLVGDVEEFCAVSPGQRRSSAGFSMQRGTYSLLHLALWRSLSVCAVSFAQRQCETTEIHGHLALLQPTQ